MLTAIKHVPGDKFCFQQDSALAHHACNTVKLQERELDFISLNNGLQLNSPAVKPTDYKI